MTGSLGKKLSTQCIAITICIHNIIAIS